MQHRQKARRILLTFRQHNIYSLTINNDANTDREDQSRSKKSFVITWKLGKTKSSMRNIRANALSN